MKILDALQPVTLLLLRFVLGIIFFTRGYPKLAGPAAEHIALFTQHGMPGFLVYVYGVVEVFGGMLLVLGLFTRVTAAALALAMGVYLWKVHLTRGYLAFHEYEFSLLLVAACLVLMSVGAGLISIDRPLLKDKSGK